MFITSFKFEVSSLKFKNAACTSAPTDSQPKTSNLKLPTSNLRPGKNLGLSLIELIVSIVVISVAVAGVLGALSLASRTSADPMVQKQALAIAEAILEEVQLKPFTFCDPDDASAATAASTADCAAIENIGPEAVNVPPTGPAETRTGTVRPFDNVNDYQVGGAGLTINPISDTNGTVVTGLEAYSANVRVAAQALNTVPATGSLLITVTVTGPDNTTVRLDGYRTRYAPNANVP